MIIECVKKIMAEKLDNQFIPKYIPSDLKWYEHEHEHSSIFRNANRNDMFVQKETINKHFKKEKAKTGIGHGQFLKKIRNDCYAKEW